jgi:hypothetical protein
MDGNMFENPLFTITIVINHIPNFTSQKGLHTMTKDFEALGRYTDSETRLNTIVEEREKIISQLLLYSQGFSKKSVIGGYVRPYNVLKAKAFIDDISRLEEEINSAISDMNANALKCEKPTIRYSES